MKFESTDDICRRLLPILRDLAEGADIAHLFAGVPMRLTEYTDLDHQQLCTDMDLADDDYKGQNFFKLAERFKKSYANPV